jgi:hypothetical protein
MFQLSMIQPSANPVLIAHRLLRAIGQCPTASIKLGKNVLYPTNNSLTRKKILQLSKNKSFNETNKTMGYHYDFHLQAWEFYNERIAHKDWRNSIEERLVRMQANYHYEWTLQLMPQSILDEVLQPITR